MEPELARRALDLARRAEKYAAPTNSGFLTPAEQAELQAVCAREREINMVLRGGGTDCERRAAFFLPSWQEEVDESQAIAAIRVTAAFGSPGHRDYLGAILALGVRRDCVGDIRVSDNTAYVFCLESIASYLLANLESVGRCGVKTARVPLSEAPQPERQYKTVSFTVKSLRLDSVCAGAFALARSAASAQIAQGNVSVNYVPCLKPDAPVRPGDILSLRGRGKATVGETGGATRKGRQFITAAIWSEKR